VINGLFIVAFAHDPKYIHVWTNTFFSLNYYVCLENEKCLFLVGVRYKVLTLLKDLCTTNSFQSNGASRLDSTSIDHIVVDLVVEQKIQNEANSNWNIFGQPQPN
jgi:hypothetical protein